jgi:hypothetical protein
MSFGRVYDAGDRTDFNRVEFQLRPKWRRKEAETENSTRLKSVVSLLDLNAGVLGRNLSTTRLKPVVSVFFSLLLPRRCESPFHP